jgi:DNA-binding transcriptional regulator YbjK
LLAAAVAIAGESGAAAVTHRGVAARAGVPLATTSYFFSSIGELLAEALRSLGAARAAELHTLADGLPAELPTDEMADQFAELLLSGDRTAELAEVESYLHAARSPELHDAIAEVTAAYEYVAAAALRAAGCPEPAAAAAAFKALTDGFVLAHLAQPRPDDRSRLSEALQALFAGYASDQGASGRAKSYSAAASSASSDSP